MMKFCSSGDGTGSRVQNKLETIELSSRKIEQERVAVVNFRVNERRSNSRGSGERSKNFEYAVDHEYRGCRIWNKMRCVEKKRFLSRIIPRLRLTSRVNRCKSDIVW
jgi:hypothetical protein